MFVIHVIVNSTQTVTKQSPVCSWRAGNRAVGCLGAVVSCWTWADFIMCHASVITEIASWTRLTVKETLAAQLVIVGQPWAWLLRLVVGAVVTLGTGLGQHCIEGTYESSRTYVTLGGVCRPHTVDDKAWVTCLWGNSA